MSPKRILHPIPHPPVHTGMKRLLPLLSLAALGLVGACAPTPKGSSYLSIRNDASREVYVTYVGGVRNVSATIAPGSRVVMRGKVFGATIYEHKGADGYRGTYVYEGANPIAMFNAIDARVLPSGDQVRVYEDAGTLRAVEIGSKPQEATK